MQKYLSLIILFFLASGDAHSEEKITLHLLKNQSKTLEFPLEVGEVNIPDPEVADIKVEDFESHRKVSILAVNPGKTTIEFRNHNSKVLVRASIYVEAETSVITIHVPPWRGTARSYVCGNGSHNQGCK